MDMDLVPVGVLRIGGDRRVATANAAAHTMLSVAPGRLPGRTVMEAFLDARLEAALDAVPPRGSARGEPHVGAELQVGATDPRVLVVRATRQPASELVVVLEDVTELRRLQQIRTQFVDNRSHELRTPISTVTLLAETLAREAEAAEVPPRMKERIARIEEETGHLAQMVNEMLDLARIEGGSQLRFDDDVDLGRLAAEAADRLRMFAERSGVVLATDIADDVPHLRGDPERL